MNCKVAIRIILFLNAIPLCKDMNYHNLRNIYEITNKIFVSIQLQYFNFTNTQ